MTDDNLRVFEARSMFSGLDAIPVRGLEDCTKVVAIIALTFVGFNIVAARCDVYVRSKYVGINVCPTFFDQHLELDSWYNACDNTSETDYPIEVSRS